MSEYVRKAEARKAQLKAIRKRCEDDLYFLCEQVLGFKDMHEPLHRPMCEFGDPRTWGPEEQIRGILVPRAHLKTSLFTIGRSAQIYLRDPDARIEMNHSVKALGMQYNGELMRQFENNALLKAIGQDVFWDDPRSDAPFWHEDRFMLRVRQQDKVPSMTVAGIESTTVGFHYHHILLDDLVTGENIGTQARRDKVEAHIRNKLAQLRPGGKILIVGTRWHPDDAYGRLMDSGVKFLVLGAYDDKGDPIFPRSKSGKAGHTKESLAQRRADMTEELFALQYLNNVLTATDRRLKTEFIQWFELGGETLQDLIGPHTIYTAVDLCNTVKSNSDFAVVMTAAIDQRGHLWVLKVDRGHFTGPKMIHLIRDHVTEWHPTAVLVESTGFQNQLRYWMQEEMLREDAAYPFKMVSRPTNKSKDERIMGMAYIFECEGVHLRKGLESVQAEAQAFRPGTESKKDQLDCLEMIYTQGKRPKGEKPKKLVRADEMAAGTMDRLIKLWDDGLPIRGYRVK